MYATLLPPNPLYPGFSRYQNVNKEISSYLRTKTYIQSPEMLAFPGLLLCGFVHWNARMTEEIRRIFEVLPAFADNVRIFSGRFRTVYYTPGLLFWGVFCENCGRIGLYEIIVCLEVNHII